ncbi:MAG: PriCT-2 domain-containing protein [Rickettsiales bacterium]|nr:PriCT-2 domain-containing protein [Rickettsiales bacterium]
MTDSGGILSENEAFSNALDQLANGKRAAKKYRDSITAKIRDMRTSLFGIPESVRPFVPSPKITFYSTPQTEYFQGLHNALDAAAGQKQRESWKYSDLRAILFPAESLPPIPGMDAIKFLVETCQVPERHIYHGGRYFDNGWDIIVSRYAGYLMARVAKNDFARAYFAFRGADLDELCAAELDFARGDRLKKAAELSQNLIWGVMKKWTDDRVYYKDVANFMNEFVYDILFCQISDRGQRISFQDLFGTWIKNPTTLSPMPYMSAHAVQFLSESVSGFINYINARLNKEPELVAANKLEVLAADYFMGIRYSLEKSRTDLFAPKNLFTQYHSSVSLRNVNAVEHGRGRTHHDNYGICFRDEDAGIAHYAVHDHLFDPDTLSCLDFKLTAMNQLAAINREISAGKAKYGDVLPQIEKLQAAIEREDRSIYGVHIPFFMNPNAVIQWPAPIQIKLDLFSEMPPMNPFAEVAQKYMEKNIPVIPVKYGAKIPLYAKDGRGEIIWSWKNFHSTVMSAEQYDIFAKTKNNIAIGLGNPTIGAAGWRLCAFDFDNDVDGRHAVVRRIIPASPCAKKGAKGFTAFYLTHLDFSKTFSMKNGAATICVVEFLNKFGKTIMPGSLHPDGNTYKWLTEDTLLNYDLEKLPVITADHIARLETLFYGDRKPQFHQTAKYDAGTTVADIRAALDKISPNCARDDWIKIGFALHNYFRGSDEGFQLFDDWSSGGEKYYSREMPNQWRSFARNTAAHEITIATLFYYAK